MLTMRFLFVRRASADGAPAPRRPAAAISCMRASAGGAPAPRRPAAAHGRYLFTRTDWPSRSCLAPVVTTCSPSRRPAASPWLVPARLAEPHSPPLHLAVAVHEHGRRAALLDQRRARDQDAPCLGRRAPLLAEERDLDAHVGQDTRIQALERRPHLDRRLLPVGGRDHGAHLGGNLPLGVA